MNAEKPMRESIFKEGGELGFEEWVGFGKEGGSKDGFRKEKEKSASRNMKGENLV